MNRGRGHQSNYSVPVTSPGWEEGGEIQQALKALDAEKPKEVN